MHGETLSPRKYVSVAARAKNTTRKAKVPRSSDSIGGSESSVDRIRSAEDLIYPHRAGISTLVLGPGCCGFVGPVPSATLDKRCRSAANRVYKTVFSCQDKIGYAYTHAKKGPPPCPGAASLTSVPEFISVKLSGVPVVFQAMDTIGVTRKTIKLARSMGLGCLE